MSGARPPAAVPALRGGDLLLRGHTEGDLPGLIEQARDPQTLLFTSTPEPYDEGQARAFLDRVRAGWAADGEQAHRRWAIEIDDRGERRYAGTIGYRYRGEEVASLDFATAPWARGQGVMTQAVALVLDHAFGEGGVRTMQWAAYQGNWGSRRIAWGFGFRISTVPGWRVDRRGVVRTGWVGTLRSDQPRVPASRWLVPPVLAGDRVVLRPWREEDRAGLQLDDLAHRYVGAALPPLTPEGFTAYLLRMRESAASGAELDWCLAHPHTDSPLGWLGIFAIDQRFAYGNATLGYWTVPAARGRGVLTEALRLAAAHAFAPAPGDPADGRSGLGLHRLAANTDVRNAASQAALVRAGWRYTGTEQDSCVYEPGGERHDTASFELVAEPAGRAGLRPTLGAPATLTTERLSLRPFTERDLPVVADLLRHPDIGPGHHPRAGTAEAERWWAALRHLQWEGTQWTWAICLRTPEPGIAAAAGDPLGVVRAYGIRRGDTGGTAHVGYWLDPAHRGHGLALEALDTVLDHLTGAAEDGGAGLSTLRADTTLDNLASQTILRHSGFRVWGREPLPDGRVRLDLAVPEGVDRVAQAALGVAATLEVPVIEGQSVRLRPWRDSDVPLLVEACNDPLAQRFLTDLPSPYTEAEAATFLASCRTAALAGSMLPWCLADPVSDECLGSLAIMELDRHRGPADRAVGGLIGYWSHPRARGRGVMTEAVRRAVRHAFIDVADGGLGLARLAITAAAGNAASQRVVLRAGFTETGRDRAAERLRDGTVEDLVRFDLLRSEWPPPDAPTTRPDVRPGGPTTPPDA
ncbi:GNAT family N-acetyltransferase [Ornithinicoccus hortensis]|uniref:RimJ/RimL family protein N-acetyltransferase n=1 Tax=Ornithinicoccus hortensis TaxID=82346 RepID=A0A542YQZ0_9MICO|nr:GNAT family N-acetyltransferase [Ornithinicoccus hortensis]TQL50344.1 RimJ/RimL family protein N-acetyltransferase [Ornithinicoccus hortensis]